MSSNRQHLRRLCHRMNILLGVFGILTAAYVVLSAGWALNDSTGLSALLARHFDTKPFPVSTPTAMLIVLLFLFQVGLFLYGLNCMRQAFSIIAGRDIIDSTAGLMMRRAGLFFAATAVAMILFTPALSALFSVSAPAGNHFISLSFGSGEALTLLMSGVVVVVGHVIALAAEVEDEIRQIV